MRGISISILRDDSGICVRVLAVDHLNSWEAVLPLANLTLCCLPFLYFIAGRASAC